MPKGFNRLGEQKIKIEIYKTQKNQEIQWGYDKFNVPIWKHQNKKGHIFIRGYQPRLNEGFLHIILKGVELYFEENRDKIGLLLTLLEPALMLFVGGSIGFIVAAMLLPIFSMSIN